MLHGVSITDPYRWLEDQEFTANPKVARRASRLRPSYLNAIPGRERIRKRIEEFLAVETISFLGKRRTDISSLSGQLEKNAF